MLPTQNTQPVSATRKVALPNVIRPITALFRKPHARDLATQRLEEYQRQLIEAESAAAFYAKMAEYYREGISRLRTHSYR